VLGVHATVERNWEGALLVEAERVFDIANRSALVSLLPGDWKLPIEAWQSAGTGIALEALR
jgi:hypothetical protein